MGSNVIKRDWFYSKICKHAKNKRILASCSQEAIDAQLAHGMVGEKVHKVQFFIVLHLLWQGHPMLEYESLRPLFEFLVVPKNNKKY
jgi:hypothetical protein